MVAYSYVEIKLSPTMGYYLNYGNLSGNRGYSDDSLFPPENSTIWYYPSQYYSKEQAAELLIDANINKIKCHIKELEVNISSLNKLKESLNENN